MNVIYLYARKLRNHENFQRYDMVEVSVVRHFVNAKGVFRQREAHFHQMYVSCMPARNRHINCVCVCVRVCVLLSPPVSLIVPSSVSI